jgi:hypothetical protein
MKYSKKRNSKKNIRKNKNTRKNKNNRNRYNKFRGGELDQNVKNIVSQNIQNKDNNLGKLLQVSCKNSDNCLALGPYDEAIKRFFDNFKNLSLINNSKSKHIGAPSKNGFIIELPFTKLNYTAYTALKCSSKPESDNLMYEYFVGKYFINNYLKKLPCFLETYDLYEFIDENAYDSVKKAASSKTINTIDIQSKIKLNNFDINDLKSSFANSCSLNKRLCILIQHFDKFTSLYDYTQIKITHEMYYLFYQLYYGLCLLGKNYTHYDLHANNVFLYKPFDGDQCILMRYHRNGKIFKFKSEYIVKIIDYGRNYFNNGTTNTKEIVENYICHSPECDPTCGVDFGYEIITGSTNDPNFDFYWINPVEPNVSHDLRAANNYKFLFDKLLNSFTYTTNFGTPEDMKGDKRNIGNIFNFRDMLEGYIPGLNTDNNKKYGSWKVAATMDIYDDGRDYDFVVLPDV